MLTCRRFGALFLFAVLAFAASACGRSYETVKVKHYRLAMTNGTPAMQDEFRRLTLEFNAYAQSEALEFVDDPAQANSSITMTKGLRAITGGKVGLGQWLSESVADSPLGFSGNPKRVVRFAMRLEFDEEYFSSRLNENGDEQKHIDKQKLFFHEVGHGLEMEHAADKQDVMYTDVSGNKDFPSFFDRVRTYLGES